MTVHKFGSTTLDLAHGAVKDLNGEAVKGVNGRPLKLLTRRELRLLAVLVEARGEVVPRERLALAVWGPPLRDDGQALSNFIHEMRRKLPPNEDGRPLVRSKRGEGYWIALGAGPAQRGNAETAGFARNVARLAGLDPSDVRPDLYDPPVRAPLVGEPPVHPKPPGVPA